MAALLHRRRGRTGHSLFGVAIFSLKMPGIGSQRTKIAENRQFRTSSFANRQESRFILA